MRRDEIYRTRERLPERVGKPGFYVVVSRNFIVRHDDVSTVVCAPVYGNILGLTTEVVLGPDERPPAFLRGAVRLPHADVQEQADGIRRHAVAGEDLGPESRPRPRSRASARRTVVASSPFAAPSTK